MRKFTRKNQNNVIREAIKKEGIEVGSCFLITNNDYTFSLQIICVDIREGKYTFMIDDILHEGFFEEIENYLQTVADGINSVFPSSLWVDIDYIFLPTFSQVSNNNKDCFQLFKNGYEELRKEKFSVKNFFLKSVEWWLEKEENFYYYIDKTGKIKKYNLFNSGAENRKGIPVFFVMSDK